MVGRATIIAVRDTMSSWKGCSVDKLASPRQRVTVHRDVLSESLPDARAAKPWRDERPGEDAVRHADPPAKSCSGVEENNSVPLSLRGH